MFHSRALPSRLSNRRCSYDNTGSLLGSLHNFGLLFFMFLEHFTDHLLPVNGLDCNLFLEHLPVMIELHLIEGRVEISVQIYLTSAFAIVATELGQLKVLIPCLLHTQWFQGPQLLDIVLLQLLLLRLISDDKANSL